MRIEYSISKQDYIAAQRLAMRSSQRMAFFMIHWYLPVLGFLMMAQLVSVAVREGLSLRLFPAFVFGAFCLALPSWIRHQHGKIYARTASMQGKLSMESSGEGLHFAGETFNATVSFSNFEKYVEDEKFFLLYQNPQIFNLVPKRELTPEQIDTLRRFFSTKIGKRELAAAR